MIYAVRPFERWKGVFVRQYTRFRFGRIESVVQHYRSYPRR